MTISFVEALNFTRIVYEYFGTDLEFAEFQNSLLANPEQGKVMPGCSGIRKTRWRDTRRGKGTRGGLRIIYLYIPEYERVLLLDVYDKDDQDNLSAAEKKILASLALTYRDEVKQARLRKLK